MTALTIAATYLAAFLGAATPFIIGGVRGELRRRQEKRAAERYGHMIGADLTLEERRERSRRLSEGAPVIRDLDEHAYEPARRLCDPLPYDAVSPTDSASEPDPLTGTVTPTPLDESPMFHQVVASEGESS